MKAAKEVKELTVIDGKRARVSHSEISGIGSCCGSGGMTVFGLPLSHL